MIKKSESSSKWNTNFTEHQLEIIREWARQPTIAAIAQQMGLSESTVQTHLRRLRKKLKVSRTFDVFLYLQENGLI